MWQDSDGEAIDVRSAKKKKQKKKNKKKKERREDERTTTRKSSAYDTSVACYLLGQKCQMRKLVVKMLTQRRQEEEEIGELGQIGNVKFEPLYDFLVRTVGRKCKTAHSQKNVVNSKRISAEFARETLEKVRKHKKRREEKAEEGEEQPIDQIIRPASVAFKTKKGQKVVSIGDIHGDLLFWLTQLHTKGLIDTDGRWVGGNTIVVQLGDILDRHGRPSTIDTVHNPREEIDILQHIHGLNLEARKDGGKIISLAGNHELMQFSAVASVLRKQRQAHELEDTEPLWAELFTANKYEGEFHVEGWGGVAAKRVAFQPGGLMACYFAIYKPVLIQINDWLFVHGGVPLLRNDDRDSQRSVESLNAEWRKFLLGNVAKIDKEVYDLMWDRSWSHPSTNSEECGSKILPVFEEFGLNVERAALVVAHTIQREGVKPFCDARVWRVDLGGSEAFKADGTVQLMETDFDYTPIKVRVFTAMHATESKEDWVEQEDGTWMRENETSPTIVQLKIQTYSGTKLISVEETFFSNLG